MSIVPLNFGADAPFKLKPHLEQTAAVSGFCVPQFGQNTPHLLASEQSTLRATGDYTHLVAILKLKMHPWERFSDGSSVQTQPRLG